MRDFLEKNDVGFIIFNRKVRIGAEGAIEGDDAEDGAFEVGAGGAFYDGGCGEASEGGCFICLQEDGEDPDAGDEHREAGAEEEEGGAGSEESEASPDPDWESGEGGEGGRHSGVKSQGDEVEADGRNEQGCREEGPQSPDAHGMERGAD